MYLLPHVLSTLATTVRQGAKQEVEIQGAIVFPGERVNSLHFPHTAFRILCSLGCPPTSVVKFLCLLYPFFFSSLTFLSAHPSVHVFVLESSAFMLIRLVISYSPEASIILTS